MKFDLPKLDKIQPVLQKLQEKAGPLLGKLGGMKSGAAAKEGPVRAVACDYGASKILVLDLEKSAAGISVQNFKIVRRPKESGKSADALKEAFAGISPEKVHISVKGQSVIIRFIQFPKMSPAELRSAIAYEAENYIPFKLDEVILDFHILGERKSDNAAVLLDLLLIAVKKEEIYPLIKDFQDADISIGLIDVDILASLNALEYLHPEEFKTGAIAFLDIGDEISSLSIVLDGKPRFIRDISFGGKDIAKRLRRKLGMTQEDAEKTLEGGSAATPESKQVLVEAVETLCSDLKVTLDYYLGQVTDARPVQKIYLGGGGGDLQVVGSILQQQLGIPSELMKADKLILAPGMDRALFEKNQRLIPVALGLCLRN
ncbi:MAG TPA: type IV pilus assembly protein PilM [Verrucomicrobiae bacterium]|jgi:type IV pilus assembly protein PilM|nr:type IV pilus assembly protein PilM [Verrucomicrobiae bacterium]